MSFCSELGFLAGPCKAIGDVKDAAFTPGVEQKIGNIKDILMSVGSCAWDKVDLVTLGTCLASDIATMSPITTGPYLTSVATKCTDDPKTMLYIQEQLAQMFGKTYTPPDPPKPGRPPAVTQAEQLQAIRAATGWAVIRQLLGKPCQADVQLDNGKWSRCRPGFDGQGYSIDQSSADISDADYSRITGLAFQAAMAVQTGTEMLLVTKAIVEAELKKLGKSLPKGKGSAAQKSDQKAFLVKAGLGVAGAIVALAIAIYIGKQLNKA